MQKLSKASFPLTAVIGQDRLKLALLLAAIDPKIGGVLIAGPRGSAKSTLARGLADIICSQDNQFVTLPLGASEEQLIGSLNLQQALAEQQVHFKPGMLAKAHGGILYVDEVNLLPDPLIDLLLDVAASGINYVERDGISHQHPAEFLLIGTMNPDEGELRPQLQDRFGLAVYLSNDHSIEQRVNIVQQRLAFDRDPQAFLEQYTQEQQALREHVNSARQKLPQITLPLELQKHIALGCIEANVDGLRADICWQRAAIAHASWRQSDEVILDDVNTVAELVLAHRRQEPAKSSPPSSPPPKSTPPASSGNNQGSQGDWGSLNPRFQDTGNKAFLPYIFNRKTNQSQRSSNLISAQRNKGLSLGRRCRGKIRSSSKVDWFKTFASAENLGQMPIEKLVYKREQHAQLSLQLVLLDTSASTFSRRAFAQAKGLVLGIAEQAYLARQQLAVLGFGNQQVDWLVERSRSAKNLRPQLDRIQCGGGTPLRQALITTQRYLQQLRQRHPDLQVKTFLITDGRSRDTVADIQIKTPLYIVDTEQGAVKLGRCQQLAQQLNAHYLHLSTLSATGLTS